MSKSLDEKWSNEDIVEMLKNFTHGTPSVSKEMAQKIKSELDRVKKEMMEYNKKNGV